MTPNANDNLTCLLLGHNFYKIEVSNTSKSNAKCKCCGYTTYINANGDISTEKNIDKSFVKGLRRLFILKRDLASSI